MILDFGKPKKLRPAAEHNAMHSSDSGVDGTYAPNMSRKDMAKWKAKKIGGDDPRVEIRKTVEGTDPSLRKQLAGRGWASSSAGHGKQLRGAIVRPSGVIMSANSRMVFDNVTWAELHQAVAEAQESLKGGK